MFRGLSLSNLVDLYGNTRTGRRVVPGSYVRVSYSFSQTHHRMLKCSLQRGPGLLWATIGYIPIKHSAQVQSYERL